MTSEILWAATAFAGFAVSFWLGWLLRSIRAEDEADKLRGELLAKSSPNSSRIIDWEGAP